MNDQERPETQAPVDEVSPPQVPGVPRGAYGEPLPVPTYQRPRRHRSWVLAVVIILVGIVLLVKNTGWLGTEWDFRNWWALFILIPAGGSFTNAWNSYVSTGRRFGSAAARSVAFGLLFLAITAIFLLELDWGKVWPVILIVVGVGLVLPRLWRGGAR